MKGAASAHTTRSGCVRDSTTLVELTGFEPVTSCLQSRRSPTELQPQQIQVYNWASVYLSL